MLFNCYFLVEQYRLDMVALITSGYRIYNSIIIHTGTNTKFYITLLRFNIRVTSNFIKVYLYFQLTIQFSSYEHPTGLHSIWLFFCCNRIGKSLQGESKLTTCSKTYSSSPFSNSLSSSFISTMVSKPTFLVWGDVFWHSSFRFNLILQLFTSILIQEQYLK